MSEDITKDNGSSDKISRRTFLKVLGATSAVAAAGCADQVNQKIIPYVNPAKEQIPGVATWFNTTCRECDAGCGLQVRTREGRAVKVEGNATHPINKGGVCALGQASLQGLYDPDRVRQPLKKNALGGFDPISWDAAISALTNALSAKESKNAIIVDRRYTQDSIGKLIGDFASNFGVETVEFASSSLAAEAKANSLVFGIEGIPHYEFSAADVILNFGADFLETWVSPCEYAKSWAAGRKGDHPHKFIHIEPRASLTAANADLALICKPGGEAVLLSYLLQELIRQGYGGELAPYQLEQIKSTIRSQSLDDVVKESCVAKDKVLLVLQTIATAKSPLVLAGGVAVNNELPLTTLVLANTLNLVLGAIGKTIDLSRVRAADSGAVAISKFVSELKKGKTDALIVVGANPAYHLPASFEFSYAANYAKEVFAITSVIDETSSLAKYILPIHTFLEDWGDHSPYEGVHSLMQPSMKPVFDTRSLGDLLIAVLEKGKKPVKSNNFQEYVKADWQSLYYKYGSGQGFETFWRAALKAGGYFAPPKKQTVSPRMSNESLKFIKAGHVVSSGVQILYPFPSVRSFDGRAANRPWLHEVPDPMSQIVWDGWAEIHPETAKKMGIEKGDTITLRNYFGELQLSAYVTDYVHPDIVAVPQGYGHSKMGRYATSIPGNAFAPLPANLSKDTGTIVLVGNRVEILKSPVHRKVVNVQGSDSQLGRGLARTSVLGAAAAGDAHGGHHGSGHSSKASAHHHDAKQMYEQREHPLYKWGLAVDLASCTGCSACVVACYAENNIPVVGKDIQEQGREMSWLRIERYHDGSSHELKVSFLPMMCQHCGNAPCEPVCPVYATYHNEEGLNAMIYNRCVGTRYCSNNCSYKARRFNWFEYVIPEPLNMQLNPDVTQRTTGIMEKCTFCVQRITEAKDKAKDLGRTVTDGEVKPACVQSCPTEALAFGNLNDPKSKVSKWVREERAYRVLNDHINTQPAVTYLEDKKWEV